MIATVRPPGMYRQQTLTTLMYASRAKKIRNCTVVNTDVAGDSATTALVVKIETLKDQLRRREEEFKRLSEQVGGQGQAAQVSAVHLREHVTDPHPRPPGLDPIILLILD